MAANRRQYTAEFKTKVVLQVLSGEKTSARSMPSAQAEPECAESVAQRILGASTHVHRLQQEFVSLAVLMDVFRRSVRGWYLA